AATVPQLPTTLPTLDELIGRADLRGVEPVDHLLAVTAGALPRDHVFTLHAELEGGAYLPSFERLLRGWQERGVRLTDLKGYAARLRRVARNRIIDRFRRNRVERRAAGAAESEAAAPRAAEDEGSLEPVLEDLLPAPDSGPESAVMREVLLAEIGAALGELPPEQREV